jgi:hypothetical protein
VRRPDPDDALPPDERPTTRELRDEDIEDFCAESSGDSRGDARGGIGDYGDRGRRA